MAIKREITNILRVQGKTVYCPKFPLALEIDSGNAYAALDVVCQVHTIEVPRSGYILGAIWYDPSDQGSAIRLHLFTRTFTIAANNAAWSPSDDDSYNKKYTLNFTSFEDDINNQQSVILDTIPYSAPESKFYIAASTPAGSTPTYTNPARPRVQLIIASDDPDWEEK